MRTLIWIFIAFLYSQRMNGQQKTVVKKDTFKYKTDTPDVIGREAKPPDTPRYNEQRKRDSLKVDDRRPKRNSRTKEDSLNK